MSKSTSNTVVSSFRYLVNGVSIICEIYLIKACPL